MVEKFQHLGFTKCRAKYLTSRIEQSELYDHQSLIYWAKLHLNSLHDSIISCKNTQENDTAANFTIEIDQEDADEPVKVPVEHVDEDEIENNQLINFYKDKSCDKLGETTYWFHGTSKEAAINIAEKGINLRRGKERGDFSDGLGFYLTSNFSFAQDWAHKVVQVTQSEDGAGAVVGAVVVFKVESGSFNGGLELTKEDTKWSKVVEYFRNGSNDRKLQYFNEYPYIFGPISKDGGKCESNPNWKPRVRSDPAPGKHLYQICLKDRALAEEFYKGGQNIEKILTF